ncbi:unnamed protein product, partial [Chrysoparadoxa australica]
DGFYQNGDFDRAFHCYQNQLASIPVQDTSDGKKLLGILYGRIGRVYHGLHKYDYAILVHDRFLALALDTNHIPGQVDALQGLAEGYLANAQYSDAIDLLKQAVALNAAVRDMRK